MSQKSDRTRGTHGPTLSGYLFCALRRCALQKYPTWIKFPPHEKKCTSKKAKRWVITCRVITFRTWLDMAWSINKKETLRTCLFLSIRFLPVCVAQVVSRSCLWAHRSEKGF